MEWLNSVKSAQGSVEVTSMRQAEAINSVGIYVVGKIDPDVQTEKPVSRVDVHRTVYLYGLSEFTTVLDLKLATIV